jgi:hypothetical protein
MLPVVRSQGSAPWSVSEEWPMRSLTMTHFTWTNSCLLVHMVSNARSASEVTSRLRFIVHLLSRLIDLNCLMSASPLVSPT